MALTIWDMVTAKSGLLPRPYFPGMPGIFGVMYDDRILLLRSTIYSMRLFFAGVITGAILGLATGILIGWRRQWDYWLSPVIRVTGIIPAAAWLIAGLDRPQSGRILIDGQEIRETSHERGYLFQQPTLFPWATVFEHAATRLKARGIYETQKHLVKDSINMIGLQGFEKNYPREISGGMAQRVAIIRALINEPKVLLLDEPLGALDAFKRIELQALLLAIWKKTGTTMVMVTHDVDEAIALSGRIVIMTPRPGEITEIFDVELAEDNRDRNSDDFILLRKKILEALHLVLSRSPPEYEM